MDKKLQDLAWSVLPKEFKEEVKEYYDNSPALGAKAVLLLENLFSIDNLTSDAEGEEMLTISRKRVQEMYTATQLGGMQQAEDVERADHYAEALRALFGSKCLPDNVDSSEPNVESSDGNVDSAEQKPDEPKYHVGQKVKFKDKDFGFEITAIEKWDDCDGYKYKLAGWKRSYRESDLEPYTEPDTSHETPVFENHSDNTSQKEVNMNSNRNLSQDTANCDKSVDNNLKDTHQNESLFGKKLDYTMTGRLLGVENLRLKIAAQIAQGILSNPTAMNGPRLIDGDENILAKWSLKFADALISEAGKGGEK